MNEWCKFTDEIHKVDRVDSRNGTITNLPAATLKPVQLLFVPLLWSPDVKNWLIAKDPDAGKDWGQEEKGMTEDETVGWHHRLDGHEFEQALGVCDGQGGPACCSSWGCKESDATEQLSWKCLMWAGLIKGCRAGSLDTPSLPDLRWSEPSSCNRRAHGTAAVDYPILATSSPGRKPFTKVQFINVLLRLMKCLGLGSPRGAMESKT